MKDAIDIGTLDIHNSPDVRGWRPTARLTQLAFTDKGVNPDFDLEENNRVGGRWPDSRVWGTDADGSNGLIQFTLWICLKIAGVWHAAGIIEYWNGRGFDGGQLTAQQVAENWVYDGRWGAMAGYRPAVGELVGFFVTQGDARGRDIHTAAERSNIVVVPFPPAGGRIYDFPIEEDAPPVVTPPPVPDVPPGESEPPADPAALVAVLSAMADRLGAAEGAAGVRHKEILAKLDAIGFQGTAQLPFFGKINFVLTQAKPKP